MNDDDTVVQVENQGAHSSTNSAPELVEEVYGAISHLNYGMNAILRVHDVEYRIRCMLCEFVIT